MAYIKRIWKNRIVEFPNRHKDQNNNVYTFTPYPGVITEQGTPITADIMNNIEKGIEDAHSDIAVLKSKSLVDTSGDLFWKGNIQATFAGMYDSQTIEVSVCKLPYDIFGRPIKRKTSLTEMKINLRHYHESGYSNHNHNATITVGYKINGGAYTYINKPITTANAGGQSGMTEGFTLVTIPLNINMTSINDSIEFNIKLTNAYMVDKIEYRDIWVYGTTYFE